MRAFFAAARVGLKEMAGELDRINARLDVAIARLSHKERAGRRRKVA